MTSCAAKRIQLHQKLLSGRRINDSRRSFAASAINMAKLDINSKIKLNSGYEIPRLGFGVYQTPADVAEEVTDHAIRNGYRLVDSATVVGG